MTRALRVELLKLRRSPVALITTALIVVLAPVLCLAFVGLAGEGGAGAAALKARAMIRGEGWDAYLGMLAQITAVAMFIGPGVVAAWAFGREHADRTFPALFALPVSRGSIATAKFVALLGFCLVLSSLVLVAAFLAGLLAQVGSLLHVDLFERLWRLFVSSFLTSMISLSVGLVASIGRGYLPAIAAVILLTMAAQIAVAFGAGAWFPYAAPGLYALAGSPGAGEGAFEVNAVQLALVPLTTFAAAWLTVRWWQRAEVV